MAKRKTINLAKFKAWANEQLARTDEYALGDPHFKAGICVAVEQAMRFADDYRGYQNLYWAEGGYTEWHNAGEPNFPEKNVFIVGPPDSKYRGSEWARLYY